MNSFKKGNELTKTEIKKRLNKLNIQFNSKNKNELIELYNNAILNEKNQNLLKNEIEFDKQKRINNFRKINNNQKQLKKKNISIKISIKKISDILNNKNTNNMNNKEYNNKNNEENNNQNIENNKENNNNNEINVKKIENNENYNINENNKNNNDNNNNNNNNNYNNNNYNIYNNNDNNNIKYNHNYNNDNNYNNYNNINDNNNIKANINISENNNINDHNNYNNNIIKDINNINGNNNKNNNNYNNGNNKINNNNINDNNKFNNDNNNKNNNNNDKIKNNNNNNIDNNKNNINIYSTIIRNNTSFLSSINNSSNKSLVKLLSQSIKNLSKEIQTSQNEKQTPNNTNEQIKIILPNKKINKCKTEFKNKNKNFNSLIEDDNSNNIEINIKDNYYKNLYLSKNYEINGHYSQIKIKKTIIKKIDILEIFFYLSSLGLLIKIIYLHNKKIKLILKKFIFQIKKNIIEYLNAILFNFKFNSKYLLSLLNNDQFLFVLLLIFIIIIILRKIIEYKNICNLYNKIISYIEDCYLLNRNNLLNDLDIQKKFNNEEQTILLSAINKVKYNKNIFIINKNNLNYYKWHY